MELIRLLDVCRLCLKQSSTYLNIFSDSNVEVKLLKVFKFELPNIEQLSKLVCLTCYECIFRFYDYSESISQNQEYLKTLLNKDSRLQQQQQQAPKPLLIIPVTEVADDGTPTGGEIRIDFQLPSTATVPPEDETHEPDAPEPEKLLTTKLSKADDLIKENIVLTCDICGETNSTSFDTFKLLQDHYHQNHNVVGYVTCCGRKFARKDRLVTHITNHINPDAFKCSVCDHCSKSRSLLRIHMKQHLGSEARRHVCTKCEKSFVLRSQLVIHEASHLEDQEKKHVCDQCGKAFALRFVLARHKRVHSRAKDFICVVCAKTLSSSVTLKAHMESHDDSATKQPKVQCSVCSQWYKNAETLRTHIRARHHDQRIHRCDRCGKVFPTKSSLSTHVKYVHLGEANFACGQCDRKFRKNVELKEHIARAHSGKSLYSCEFCDKSFSCSSNYFSHRKNKHPKEHAKQVAKKQRNS
ncbi:zinc finger protein 501-like [Wyeomyia smithii]|uniref:zinc finger protein 501-like n=1 Tax=Wyeomyia smithii TaxID=174621 RepID=UPI002467C483|nr:zinc finger protein 501-like [Wyeomyia smithii]